MKLELETKNRMSFSIVVEGAPKIPPGRQKKTWFSFGSRWASGRICFTSPDM